MSYDQPTPPAYPTTDVPVVAEAPKAGTSGLTIAGFILAFFIAPIGFILSLIGLIQTSGGKRKGKGLAIAGIIVSILVSAAWTGLLVLVLHKAATILDSGCTTGKAALLDNSEKVSNPATLQDGLKATIAGLNSAADKSSNAEVRDAMRALSDDYSKLLASVQSGVAADSSLNSKLTTDAAKIDSLCSATIN